MTQKISIVGMGYVGLCTAVTLAHKGYSIIAVDKDKQKLEAINNGVPPFHEPDLEKLMQEANQKRSINGVLDTELAIKNTDITFITVGTPSNPDGSINLEQIKSSAIEIGNDLQKKDSYHLVIVKSTVVPGTSENVVKALLEKNSGKTCGVDFGLCMNPEFLREGSAVNDALHPDRIVIGEHDQKSGDVLQRLYSELHAGESVPVLRTNLPTAELIKYVNNAFLATKISYINTIANICEKIPDADVVTVAQGIGLDQRINPQFFRAGLGYGGSCFPKDVNAIVAFSKQLGYEPKLLEATHEINENQAKNSIEKLKKKLNGLKGKTVAILGLSFKPDSDDMRESRAIPVINKLLKEGSNVVAYDPVAIPTAKLVFGNKIQYAPSAIDGLKGADCCILVTEWNEFKKLKAEDFKQHMKQPVLMDGRRIYAPKEFSEKIDFCAIGYAPSDA